MVILGTSVPVVVHGIVVMIEEWTTRGMEEWSVGVMEYWNIGGMGTGGFAGGDTPSLHSSIALAFF
jgi:hypothetical protein